MSYRCGIAAWAMPWPWHAAPPATSEVFPEVPDSSSLPLSSALLPARTLHLRPLPSAFVTRFLGTMGLSNSHPGPAIVAPRSGRPMQWSLAGVRFVLRSSKSSPRSPIPLGWVSRVGPVLRADMLSPLSRRTRGALVLCCSSNDGLRWVAWANVFSRGHSIAATGKLSLAHATHQITCIGALEPVRSTHRSKARAGQILHPSRSATAYPEKTRTGSQRWKNLSGPRRCRHPCRGSRIQALLLRWARGGTRKTRRNHPDRQE